jgi:hypothetical protein
VADQKLQPSITVQQARSRLDAALERLEKAVDAAPAGGDKLSGLAAELSGARSEIAVLENKNSEVSERLGSAIGRVKAIIGG